MELNLEEETLKLDNLIPSGEEPIQSENVTPFVGETIHSEKVTPVIEEHKVVPSLFLFKNLKSLSSQQEILDFLTVDELLRMCNLNKLFRRLWESGVIPTKITVETVKVAHPKLLIAILSRPLVRSVVSFLDLSCLMYNNNANDILQVVEMTAAYKDLHLCKFR